MIFYLTMGVMHHIPQRKSRDAKASHNAGRRIFYVALEASSDVALVDPVFYFGPREMH